MPAGGDLGKLLVDGALWLNDHIDLVSPWRDGEFSLEGVQSLGEISLTYRRVASSDSEVVHQLARDAGLDVWRSHALAIIEQRAFSELPLKRPLQAFPLLLPYLSFRALGYRDDGYEEVIQWLARHDLLRPVEAVPYRELDADYFLDLAGIAPARDRSAMVRRTFLGWSQDPLFVNDDLAYSLTHTLFYVSDFGLLDAEKHLGKRRKAYATRLSESLLVHHLRTSHWDLVAELVLGLAILDALGPLTDFALRCLMAEQRPDGALVGHGRQADDQPMERGALFSKCYHTTLVGVLLATAGIERARA